MRISDFKKEVQDDHARVSATVTWEDSQRPSQQIFYETSAAFQGHLNSNPDAFLAGAVVPAFWGGEGRVQVKGEVCPELCENLKVALRALQHWFKPDQTVTRIEAKPRSRPREPGASRRAGFFFSGGIDSLSSLRANHLAFPPEHPGFIQDGLLILGLEVESAESFQHVRQQLSIVAEDAGVTLIPISTNLRSLNDDWGFWYTAWMGAGVCAAAHVLGERLSVATIASDYDVPYLKPHGSHPLMEPNFSSYEVRIRYDGLALSRLAKTKLVADWDAALQNLRVCNREQLYRAGHLNCGECEKCIRTMLALEALGALGKSRAFPHASLTPDLVVEKAQLTSAVIPFYVELLGPLSQTGRYDLAKAVQYTLDRAEDGTGWKGCLRRFDRKYLNRVGRRLKRTLLATDQQ